MTLPNATLDENAPTEELSKRLRNLFDKHSDTRANPDILEAANLLDRPVSSTRVSEDVVRSAALAELVALKDLKERFEPLKPKDLSGSRNYYAEELEEEYERRKGPAWERARAALEGAPSATPRSDGMPLLFNVFNMICQDRDEDWKEQWRELMKEIELVLTRAGYTMPKAGGDYAVAAPIRPTDDGAQKS